MVVNQTVHDLKSDKESVEKTEIDWWTLTLDSLNSPPLVLKRQKVTDLILQEAEKG